MISVPIASLVRPVATWNPIAKAPDDEIQYIDIGAVDNVGKCITTPQQVLGSDAPSRARQLVADGDVLVSTVRPALNAVAAVESQFDGATASTGFCVLRPEPTKLSPRYLFNWVKSPDFVSEMVRRATGASYPAVSDGIVGDSKIPLPPLSEQRRIAEILDRAESLRAQRRQALAQLDALGEAIFLEMFGTTNWPLCPVGELCRVLGGKRLPKGTEYATVPTPFRYVRVTDLRDGEVDEAALLHLKPEVQSQIARYTVAAGDIIVSIAGSIGLIAEVPASVSGANLTENAAKLVAIESDRYVPAFLAAALRSPGVQDQMAGLTGQVTIGKLALFRIEQVVVPLPPVQLQRQYALRMAALKAARVLQAKSMTELNALFASLQHRAFRGEP